MKYGYQKGDSCSRGLIPCQGIIEVRAPENCSCHISPPCSQCVEAREFCPVCDYEAKNDIIFNDHVVNVVDGIYKTYEPRPLDSTKIDWRTLPHTNSSQLCEGVYPEGTTRDQIEKLVKGTFGGRFDQFRDGKFIYVAYTD